AYRDTCEATRSRDEQSEGLFQLRLACLEHARAELAALASALGRDVDDDSIALAVSQSAVGPDLLRCRNADGLRAVVPAPRDPDVIREVADIGAELNQVQADTDLGRFESASAAIRILIPRARAVGFAPLVARTLLMAGKLAVVTGDSQSGIALLYEAA